MKMRQLIEQIEASFLGESGDFSLSDPAYKKPVRVEGAGVGVPLGLGMRDKRIMGPVYAAAFPSWDKAKHKAAASFFEGELSRLAGERSELMNKGSQAAWGRDWRMGDLEIGDAVSSDFPRDIQNDLKEIASQAYNAKLIALGHAEASKFLAKKK